MKLAAWGPELDVGMAHVQLALLRKGDNESSGLKLFKEQSTLRCGIAPGHLSVVRRWENKRMHRRELN